MLIGTNFNSFEISKVFFFCAETKRAIRSKSDLRSLMNFKQNRYRSWKYTKVAIFKSFLHLVYKNTQLLFLWQCFLINKIPTLNFFFSRICKKL